MSDLKPEIEAALDLLGSCGCAIVPCTCGVKASIATLRTALTRAAHIEAALAELDAAADSRFDFLRASSVAAILRGDHDTKGERL
jgi:hypothetical protein